MPEDTMHLDTIEHCWIVVLFNHMRYAPGSGCCPDLYRLPANIIEQLRNPAAWCVLQLGLLLPQQAHNAMQMPLGAQPAGNNAR